jgi:hypothetical protein
MDRSLDGEADDLVERVTPGLYHQELELVGKSECGKGTVAEKMVTGRLHGGWAGCFVTLQSSAQCESQCKRRLHGHI